MHPASLKIYTFSNCFHLFKLHGAGVEGALGQLAQGRGLTEGKLLAPPRLMDLLEIFGQGSWGSSEANASGAGGGDALLLTAAYVFAFVLRGEGEDLQNEVGDEGAHKVLALPCVEQGHVEHADIDVKLLGEEPPLLLDLLIVAAQPVNAEDAEQVAGAELFDQSAVLRTVEVLAGLSVEEDVFVGDALFMEGDFLSVVVLFGA